jgi:dienelactone hydrolase
MFLYSEPTGGHQFREAPSTMDNETAMRTASIFTVCVVLLSHAVAASTEQYRTYVAPSTTETMQGPCEYEMTLRDTTKPVTAVFVIFDRGWQFGNLYFDPEVTAFAERHRLALVLARHCRSKEREDMDVVPQHGIGRALLAALDQLAADSHHPELASSKLIVYSFSGGGSLVARMAGYVPDRILAVIAYAPGQYEPLGMDTIDLPDKALVVPQFIIANGADGINGTARPYGYFERYRKLGAPLTFMIQNRTPHCCVMNVTSIVLLWLGDVIEQRLPLADKPLRAIDVKHAWKGFIKPEDSGVRSWKTESVWNVAAAWIEPYGDVAPLDAQDAGWLPSKRFAESWLTFENAREHPITPLE